MAAFESEQVVIKVFELPISLAIVMHLVILEVVIYPNQDVL